MTIRNIAIPRKLALAFAVLIATFSIVSLMVFANVRTLHQVAVTRDEAKLASDHADDMLNGVVEGQSAVRGYVLLGKPAFLETYKENAAAITAAAAEFNRHAARPDQAERVQRVLAALVLGFDNRVPEIPDPAAMRAIAMHLSAPRSAVG